MLLISRRTQCLFGRVMRIGVFPPVQFRTGVIFAEDEVEVAVTIDVGDGSAGLDVEPAIDRDKSSSPSLPRRYQTMRRPGFTARDHDVVQAVFINVEHQARRLLPGSARRRQVAGLARQSGPSRDSHLVPRPGPRPDINPTRRANEIFIADLRASSTRSRTSMDTT